MVTEVAVATAVVVMGNEAVLAPPDTFTLSGTWATVGLLLERFTAAPLVGAEALSVTVPVDPDPPATLGGFKDSEVKTSAGDPPP